MIEATTMLTFSADKPVMRETSPNWHTNISYAEDVSIVEVVLFDFGTLGKLNQQLVKAPGC